jgi:two-component system, cell cycle sensor histidine kinase and response regulator CckA
MKAFDLFFENHPTPMWIYDLETLAFLAVNNAATLKYGYSKEEFLQLTLRDIRPAAEIPRLLADIEQARPEWQQSGLWPHQLRDGTLIQVEITSHTIEFNGRSAALVMAQDRTEQVALQNELIRREAQLRTTLYSIGDAVIATDINGRVTLMNPVATQLTGWPESEAQGRPLEDIFPIINEYSRQPVDNPVTQVLQEGVTVGLANHTLLIHRDGSERPIADAAAPIWGVDNQLTGVVLIFRDQTAERQAQTAIRQAKKRLERAEEQAGLGSWEFDIGTQEGYWSPQMFRLFDLEPAAETPEFDTYLTLIHPEDRPIVQQALTTISSGRAPFSQTYRTNPDKVTPRYLRPSWRIRRDETGQPVRFEGTLLDVTQQFEAEEKIGYQASLIENVSDAIISTDLEFTIRSWNPAAEALYGWSAQEAIGQPLEQLVQTRYYNGQEQKQAEQQLAEHGVWKGQVTQTDKEGTEQHIFSSVSLIYTHQKRPLGMVAVNRNITEQVQHEQEAETTAAMSKALRVARSRADMLPIILENCLTLLNVDGAALETVEAVEDRLLLELGSGIWTAVSGQRYPRQQTVSDQILQTGDPYLQNEAAANSTLHPALFAPCQAVAGVPLVAQEQPIGMLWIGSRRRLTNYDLRLLQATGHLAANAIQRASLHEKTRRQAEQMAQIMGNVPDGILLLDADYHLQQANPRAVVYLDRLADVGIGQRLTHLGPYELAASLTSRLPEQQRIVITTDQIVNGQAAQAATFEVLALPIESDTAVTGWIIIIRDITEELALQQQLQQQERLAAVGQLAAGMAHDFNNIMGVIILYAQFLARSAAFSEIEREQLATIETQANRASALIEQMLDFSRQAMLARQPLDLRQLLREEIKLLQRTLPEHIEIELVSEEAEYMVQADPTRLQQSFMNLALNARDAMPEGGQLRFILWQQHIDKGERPSPDIEPGHWICLQVSDTGQGIETTVLDHIFEPFFTTKETGTGTGLGLAQVYGIIRQHGGHVLVKSQPGQGSTFTIYLPALATTAVRQETRSPADAPAGSGQLLLIVEDQAALRAALVDSLQAWGYQTAEAAHGEEALAILHKRNREIALVLSDVIMPRMGGVALAQAIREQGWSIPIILLTGHPQEEKETLEAADIWALLAKPVDSTRLAQAIAAALA